MFFFDMGYMLMVFLPALAIGGLASWMTKSTFSKYSKYGSRNGYTGAEAAMAMLRRVGITDVSIKQTGGMLSDHYNPVTKTLALSEDVYHSNSLSAIGVACHEAGHAIQHARSFAPLMLRSALAPVTSICSSLYIWPILIGFFTGFRPLAMVGFIMCIVALIFALITLPVEWDASRRAKLAMVEQGIVSPQEASHSGKVLNAAFMTYIAAVVASLLTVLYWAMRLGFFGRRWLINMKKDGRTWMVRPPF